MGHRLYSRTFARQVQQREPPTQSAELLLLSSVEVFRGEIHEQRKFNRTHSRSILLSSCRRAPRLLLHILLTLRNMKAVAEPKGRYQQYSRSVGVSIKTNKARRQTLFTRLLLNEEDQTTLEGHDVSEQNEHEISNFLGVETW